MTSILITVASMLVACVVGYCLGRTHGREAERFDMKHDINGPYR